jgi:hypothetical protein
VALDIDAAATIMFEDYNGKVETGRLKRALFDVLAVAFGNDSPTYEAYEGEGE